jgi:hypothetical protein
MPRGVPKKSQAKPEAKPEAEQPSQQPEVQQEHVERQAVGVVERQASDAPQQKRLSITLNEDGTVAWDRMRGNTVAEFKSTIKNDPIAAAMFAGPSSSAMYTNDDAATALGLFVGVECFVFEKVLKIDPSITRQVFPFDESEHQRLDPQVAAVLNKHASAIPTWVTRYREEIVLAKTLVDITIAKIIAAKQMQGALLEAQREQARAEHQQQRRRNGQAISMETGAEMPISQ